MFIIFFAFIAERHFIYYLKKLLSVEDGLTEKSCSILTERKGESRQLVVGVTVQRETLMCGADKTLVCCAPVRPAHPSHAKPGRGNVKEMLIGPCQHFMRVRVRERGGEMDRASLLIHRSEVHERRAAGGCPLELRR